MFSKKNFLITSIVISMLVGLVIGYFINRSIADAKPKFEETIVVKSSNPVIIKAVKTELKKQGEKYFKENKKQVASRYSILSDIFLRLIKMIIAPLVFAVLVIGVAKVGDFKSVGRIGLKTIVYFTSATLIALMLGLLIVNIFQPGKVMHLDLPDVKAETGIKSNAQDAKNFISHVIPDSVISTASSESAMPKTIEALENHGISNRIVSFVLPLGYSFNLDGSIMYMTFATVFIAQSYGMDISTADQIKMMLILLVTSKGMAGVPRASLVVIAGMLGMFKIPGEGLLLLLAVDQILDMGRSATNVVGNAVASAVVARLEGEKF